MAASEELTEANGGGYILAAAGAAGGSYVGTSAGTLAGQYIGSTIGTMICPGLGSVAGYLAGGAYRCSDRKNCWYWCRWLCWS